MKEIKIYSNRKVCATYDSVPPADNRGLVDGQKCNTVEVVREYGVFYFRISKTLTGNIVWNERCKSKKEAMKKFEEYKADCERGWEQ